MSRTCMFLLPLLLVFLSAAEEDRRDELSPDQVKMQYEYVRLIFKERRREQHDTVKRMLKKDAYEERYKLLDVSLHKLLEVINERREMIHSFDYEPLRDGFPMSNITLQGVVVMSLDSCCLAAENVLHFPDISYRIFRKTHADSWLATLNWCILFVQSFPDVTDAGTLELMNLLRQEINADQRAANYINPYSEEAAKLAANTTPPKQHRKIKKGPQLNEL